MLAKHDETYMPKEVADALKKSGHWKDDYAQAGGDAGRGRGQVIAELGHYALMLALGLALIQGSMPIVGARSNDAVLMSMAAPAALAQFVFVALAFARARRLLRHLRLLGAQRLREFELGDAADLPAHQRLGQPRRLDDAVGVHPGVVRRAGRGVRQQSAGQAQGQCAGGAGLDRRGLPSVHSHHVESVPAHCRTRRSRAAISIRSCRIPASPSIRRCSISAMSASRSRSPLRSRR